ncbi:MAG TPA: hypothetical protein VGP39_24735, partial [Bradyrhizobium sp.]|nr:hypothetical protein [Bradyrhizobium sp.]
MRHKHPQPILRDAAQARGSSEPDPKMYPSHFNYLGTTVLRGSDLRQICSYCDAPTGFNKSHL